VKSGNPKEKIKKAKKAWKQATTFSDLCELTAQFIEERSPFLPGYGADSVDSETEPLVPYLAAFNHSGFLTTTSQPGEDHSDLKQRAFVDGFALEGVARRIHRVSLYSELHIVATPPGFPAGFHTPVTVSDFMPHTWTGFSCFGELEYFEKACGAFAFQELRTAWSVSIIDLQWGRNDYLWPQIAQAICYSEKPHPDLELDCDFVGPVDWDT